MLRGTNEKVITNCDNTSLTDNLLLLISQLPNAKTPLLELDEI